MDTILIAAIIIQTCVLIKILFVILEIKNKDIGKQNKKKIFSYFRTPSDEKFELDWSLRQFFRLFNTAASERWYESRAHCYQGVLISLLCAFNIINVVRYEFYTDDDDSRLSYHYKFYTGFQDKQRFIAKLISEENGQFIQDFFNEKHGIYSIFLAGSNVVMDGW